MGMSRNLFQFQWITLYDKHGTSIPDLLSDYQNTDTPAIPNLVLGYQKLLHQLAEKYLKYVQD
jgi:hypothetical protein